MWTCEGAVPSRSGSVTVYSRVEDDVITGYGRQAGRQRRELEDARGLGHENHQQGFPRGSVVKNLPANAGDTGSIPGPGRYHMLWSNYTPAPKLLTWCSRAQELQLLKPWDPRAGWCSITSKATAMRSLPTTTRE